MANLQRQLIPERSHFTLFQFLLLGSHLSTGVICVPHKCVACEVFHILVLYRHPMGTIPLLSG